MSRSLRSRPLTLYGSPAPGGQQQQHDQRQIHPQQRAQHGPAPTSSSASRGYGQSSSGGNGAGGGVSMTSASSRQRDKAGGGGGNGKRSGLSKASKEVTSNLKKRLSMRYAEPTAIGPSGFSAPVPAVPQLPPEMTLGQTQYALYYDHSAAGGGGDSTDTAAAYAGADMGGMPPAMYAGQPLPIMGHGFDQQGYLDPHSSAMGSGVPGGGGGAGAQHRRSGESSRSGEEGSQVAGSNLQALAREPGVDVSMLSKDAFDPQEYLRRNLYDSSSDAALREFRQALQGAKKAALSDLQGQVFKNYHELINIAKEIGALENEMLELKELLKEWKGLPSALELEEGSGILADAASRSRSLRGNRNSMVDLQQIYRAQITSLWESIEGSQKFLAFKPGRHLIAEASSFTELNAATYKPKQGVSLYLLDDLLLVAVRKKRQMSAKVRLVAERCFALSEIVVIDLKDGGDLTNAVKIKRGKEAFVYRTERAEDKRALLNAFRRVAEELAAKRRKESLAEAEARKRESSLITADVGGGASGAGSVDATSPASSSRARAGGGSYGDSLTPESAGSVMAQAAASAAAEKKEPGKWSSDFADELAVAIALREWGDAVAMIEKAKGVLSTYAPTDPARANLASKLNALVPTLVSAISHDLSSPTLKKSGVVRDVGYLLRLDEGERARELFLAARSELLRRRSRQIKFEGDVGLHICELSLVHFTLVKHTSEWYMAAFRDNRMASGFVRWASSQIEAYAEIFRRQVYGVAEQERDVVRAAVAVTKRNAEQLKDVGLDFGFLLDELLRPEGMARPIPALTLTVMDETSTSSSARERRLSATPAQELRRQSMQLLAAQ